MCGILYGSSSKPLQRETGKGKEAEEEGRENLKRRREPRKEKAFTLDFTWGLGTRLAYHKSVEGEEQ